MQNKNQLIEQVQKARKQLAAGQEAEAARVYESLAGQAGDEIELNIELGHLCMDFGATEQAIAHFHLAVQHEPYNPEYLGYLGMALEARGRVVRAYEVLERAIEQGNTSINVMRAMGAVCIQRADFQQARDYLEPASKRKPSDYNIRVILAIALAELNEHEEALIHARQAIKLGATSARAYFVLGQILSELGRFDEAVAQLEETVRRHKKLGSAYHVLAQMRKFSADDQPFIAKTEKMLEYSMPPTERESFHFALGKMYDDCGDQESAFFHYQKANTLRKVPFEMQREERIAKRIRKMFNQSAMSNLRARGHESAQPIFVVGMPRSGTTLIERIIAAHPQGAGAGELPEISRIREKVLPESSSRRALAEARAELTADRIWQYAEEYLQVLRKGREDATRIVDKMPGNFMDVGLIATLFPNATIINAIRHPLDVAFSCYCQRFAKLTWTGDFSIIARVYAMYSDFMKHWKRVLPEGQIVDVHYEQLVQDQEGEGARLLQACGLDWNESVLDFHKREGLIRTASLAQARQPIYQSSRMRWTRYAPWLGEVAAELEPFLPEDRQQLEAYGVPMPRAGMGRWVRKILR